MGNRESTVHDRSAKPRDSREHLARVLKTAFPTPDSGAFGDLLAALDAAALQQR